MTRDDVIRMALEVGVWIPMGGERETCIDTLERFAALVAAAERKACAKAIENSTDQLPDTSDWANGYIQAAKDIAEGIHARGNQ